MMMKGFAVSAASLCVLWGVELVVNGEPAFGDGHNCDQDHRLGIHSVHQINYSGLEPALESGSPVSVEIKGKTRAYIAPGSVKMQVRPKSENEGAIYSEFQFDFCDQVAGVQCPMPAETEFVGVATWNLPRMSSKVFKEAISIDPPQTDAARVSVHISFRESVGVDDTDENAAIRCDELTFLVSPEVEHTETVDLLMKSSASPVNDPLLVEKLNDHPEKSWVAELSPRFEGYSIMDARRIAGGTVMRGQQGFEELERREYASVTYREGRRLQSTTTAAKNEPHTTSFSKGERGSNKHASTKPAAAVNFDEDDIDDIPDSFDSRDAFPECAEIIGRIRDQSDCGSCWAFASTEAFNDRRCVAAIGNTEGDKGDMLVELSAEDTTACCSWFHCGFSMGCNGGQPGSAWKWFTSTGVVSGGDFADIGTGLTCKPYEFQPCAHHVDPGASGYPECPDSEYPTPECLSSCSDTGFQTTYGQDKRKAKKAYSLIGIQDIQRDMMKHGSVTAAFSVYSDFPVYAGGVYKYTEGSYLGGHAVKIIGWGTDEKSGLDYWLVANSWNDSWGENGFFRILRGVNECGIEAQVVAGEA